MTRMHAQDGGLSDDQAARINDRAHRLEQWVADIYGGWTREEGDWADVDIPWHGPVDVKSVPSIDAGFVNGGAKRPVVTAVVATDSPRQLVLGIIDPAQWQYGVPVVPGRLAQRCWHVRRSDVFPPTGPWIRIGCVLPEWYRLSDDELLHIDWNDRNRRRVERRLAVPESMPWADPESVKKGTGLASRKGHAPGKDNHRRKRS